MLIFVLPHQFLPRLLPTIEKVMEPGAKAISLIKVMCGRVRRLQRRQLLHADVHAGVGSFLLLEGCVCVCVCVCARARVRGCGAVGGSVTKCVHALCVCACCQGIDFDEKGLVLISDNIRKALSIDVSVLMGANVAKEV